ncbi:MAG TPA: 30S ribosomal protein S4 [bacterium]|nr:30S ribosomal protein S4 [bacterium]
MAVVVLEREEEYNMSRNLKPNCKQCRRLGVKLCTKGLRGDGAKCALTKRNYPPGAHGPKGYKRLTDYGLHLQEKQKIKLLYGLMERQLRKVFAEASKAKGDTGLKLVELLERRLDNVVYRLGLATSRPQARQFVGHNLLLVNGKKLNIPSYLVKINDVISIKKNKGILADNLKNISHKEAPSWINWDTNETKGVIISLPADKELEIGIDPRLIVEFYSK